MKALKGFIKPFVAPQRNVKIENSNNFHGDILTILKPLEKFFQLFNKIPCMRTSVRCVLLNVDK